MTSEYERELAELRRALELPVVGHPRRDAELTELRRLIGKYVEDAHRMLEETDDRHA
ncbi:hypothetical protein GCM10029978_110450 [Actinoallomurus acanthiterrae]